MLANLRYILIYIPWSVWAASSASCYALSLLFSFHLGPAKFAIKRNSMSLAYNWQKSSDPATAEPRQTMKRYKIHCLAATENDAAAPSPFLKRRQNFADKMLLNFLSLIFSDAVFAFSCVRRSLSVRQLLLFHARSDFIFKTNN